MKTLIITSIIFFSSFVRAECPSISLELEKFISEHATAVRGGEYCKFRSVYKNNQIEVALYTIEGACNKDTVSPQGSCGNHYIRYMLGVVDGKPIPAIVVGGKGSFLTQNIEIKSNEIEISGFSYDVKDPMCCPSVSAVQRYKINNGAFVEEQP